MRKWLTMLVFLVALIASVPASQSPVQGQGKKDKKAKKPKVDDEALKKRLADLNQWFVKKHLEYAERYAKVKVYTGARIHAFRVLSIDPENKDAREILGHKPQETGWDTSEEIPRVNPNETRSSTRARNRIGKDYGSFASEATTTVVALARDFERSDALRLEAKKLWWRALLYDATNTDAHKARGFVKYDEVWVPESSRKEMILARTALKDASEGLVDESKDTNQAGITFSKRKTAFFKVRTEGDQDRAKRLMKIAIAASKYTAGLLGMKGKAVRYVPYTFTHLANKENFGVLFLELESENKKRKEIVKSALGHSTKNPFGFMLFEKSDKLNSEDLFANEAALEALVTLRNSDVSPWIKSGFPYFISANLLNTAITQRYRLTQSTRTRVYRPESERVKRGNPFAPEDFRLIVRELVASGEDLPLLELAKLSINKINEYHSAKAFSIFEFLFIEHRKAAQAWLSKGDQFGVKEIEMLAKSLKLNETQFEALWREWVLKNY